MNWLLKIVEGPMQGAEIALVNGTRIKVGAGDACDIVVADATLKDVAFELDVTDREVSVIVAGAEPVLMKSCEVRKFGSTALVVGPAEGAWTELTYYKEPEVAAEKPAEEEAAPAETPAAEDAMPAAPEKAEGPHAESPKTDVPDNRPKHGLLWKIVVIILLFAILGFIFLVLVHFCAPVKECVRPAWEKVVFVWRGWFPNEAALAAYREAQRPKLPQIAAQYNLKLSQEKGLPFLKGNLTLRTERMAIRALALAADRRVQLDLTDDETLSEATKEMLFVLTEGDVKLAAASNRAVGVKGQLPSLDAFRRVVMAVLADVPAVENMDASQLVIDGYSGNDSIVEQIRNSQGRLVASVRLPKGVSRDAWYGIAQAGPIVPSKVAIQVMPDGRVVTNEVAAVVVPEVKPVMKPTAGKKSSPARAFPIAGILTKPYACIVLSNGTRVVEGGSIGSATVIRIAADRLTFKEGNRTFDWEP